MGWDIHWLSQWVPNGDIWQYLGTFWVVTTGVGGCYWHPVGRGWGFCSTPPSAQDSSRQKRMTQQLKCQSCRGAGCLLQASVPAMFCSTPKCPFQRIEVAPQTSPTPISESFPPQVSSNKSVWRDRGEKKTETLLETWNKDVLSIHQLLPRGRNPRRGQSLVKQENVRLNSGGNPSTPPAWQPMSGQFLLAQKSTFMNRHRTSLPGQPGGKRGRTGRWQLC